MKEQRQNLTYMGKTQARSSCRIGAATRNQPLLISTDWALSMLINSFGIYLCWVNQEIDTTYQALQRVAELGASIRIAVYSMNLGQE